MSNWLRPGKRILLALMSILLILSIKAIHAQQKTVSGVVSSAADKQPLP